MSLFGGEEADFPGTSNMSMPTCCSDGSSDSHSLDKQERSVTSTQSFDMTSKKMRDVHYSKGQAHRMKRKEQEIHKSRNSDNTIKDEYFNTCSEQGSCSVKGEKKFRTIDMKYNVEYEGNERDRSYDKYQSRQKNKYADRESNQSRERKRKKSSSKSEFKYGEYREAKKDREEYVMEKHEVMKGQYRESSSGKHKRKGKSDDKYEHHSNRKNSEVSRHSKSKGC